MRSRVRIVGRPIFCVPAELNLFVVAPVLAKQIAEWNDAWRMSS